MNKKVKLGPLVFFQLWSFHIEVSVFFRGILGQSPLLWTRSIYIAIKVSVCIFQLYT